MAKSDIGILVISGLALWALSGGIKFNGKQAQGAPNAPEQADTIDRSGGVIGPIYDDYYNPVPAPTGPTLPRVSPEAPIYSPVQTGPLPLPIPQVANDEYGVIDYPIYYGPSETYDLPFYDLPYNGQQTVTQDQQRAQSETSSQSPYEYYGYEP